MQFKEVIGQEEVKKKLILSAKENRIPHAQLFLGPEGCGSFALALAYAQYILYPNRDGHDSCGVCPSCRQIAKPSQLTIQQKEHNMIDNDRQDFEKTMQDDNCLYR